MITTIKSDLCYQFPCYNYSIVLSILLVVHNLVIDNSAVHMMMQLQVQFCDCTHETT